jgi:hypothetical protein
MIAALTAEDVLGGAADETPVNVLDKTAPPPAARDRRRIRRRRRRRQPAHRTC